jgi:hypothetical protein
MRSVHINMGVSCFVGRRGIMQQSVAHKQTDAADAWWSFDDDDDDRPAETLQLLPGSYPGTARFGMSHLELGGIGSGPAKSLASGRMVARNGEWGILDGSGRHSWVAAVGSI